MNMPLDYHKNFSHQKKIMRTTTKHTKRHLIKLSTREKRISRLLMILGQKDNLTIKSTKSKHKPAAKKPLPN